MMRVVIVVTLLGCGSPGNSGDDTPTVDATADSTGDGAAPSRWQPTPGTSWQWQLQGTIDTSVVADVFDIDLFDTPVAVIDELHTKGRKVICYFDTAYEPNRPESAQLEPYRGSEIDGWPGQYWLDIRVQVVRDIMVARIERARAQGCDGVEPDDVDVASNDTVLGITPAQQLDFIELLAREAHARGLAIGLKNDLEQIPELVGEVDFAVNEECFEYDECDALAPFIAANKPVWNTEYTAGDLATKGAAICPGAIQRNFDTLIKHLDLGPERHSCR